MKIEELHDRLFDVLCTIDDICQKENISYFLDSGTEIGSVREHDFIAWDDDMDLKVLAEDYPKFKRIMEKNLPSYMHVIEPQEFSPFFYDFIIRIVDDRYRLRQETEEDRKLNNYQNMVGTDVFLFAKVPNGKYLRMIYRVLMQALYGFGMGHRVCVHSEKYTKKQKVMVAILMVIGKHIPVEKIVKWFYKLVNLYEKSNFKYRIPANYRIAGNGFSKDYLNEWYKSSTFGIIRGRKFPIPNGYDGELRVQYGEYLVPDNTQGKYIRHLQKDD